MDRKEAIEACYKYGFDGSTGVFRWDDQDHLFQGLLAFETFVNDYEVEYRNKLAEELRQAGYKEAANHLAQK